MKTLTRIVVLLLVLIVVIVIGGYFVVTNAGFQKRILESRLPAGSSVESIHVTLNSLQLSKLYVAGADGTRIEIGEIDVSFKPLAALFSNTLKLGVLEVDELRVVLPKRVAGATVTDEAIASESRQKPAKVDPKPESAEPGQAWESLHALNDLDWLLDIEKIDVNGQLLGSTGTVYDFSLESAEIRPAQSAQLNVSLQMVTSASKAESLNELNSLLVVSFLQKAGGGLESLRIESETAGKDSDGNSLLKLSELVELSFDGETNSGVLNAEFDVAVKNPGMFLSDLDTFGSLAASGSGSGKLVGESMTLDSAQLLVLSDTQPVVEMQLQQPLTLGGRQAVVGELLDLEIISLPLAWLQPWLPEEVVLEGNPISIKLAMVGYDDGALALTAPQTIQLGPWMLQDEGEVLFDQVSLSMEPLIVFQENGAIDYTLKAFQMKSQEATLLEADVSGRRLVNKVSAVRPLAGTKLLADLNIQLGQLLDQPLFASRTSVAGGVMPLHLTIDGDSELPIQLKAEVIGLSAESISGTTKDYSLQFDLQSPDQKGWGFSGALEAGAAPARSTNLRVQGKINPAAQPMTFFVDVEGPILSQSDITFLAASLQSPEAAVASASQRPSPRPSNLPEPTAPTPPVSAEQMAPVWAGLDGQASVSIDRIQLESMQRFEAFKAQALVSEPLLQLNDISLKVGAGSLQGAGEIRYTSSKENAYQVITWLNFEGLDTSVFSSKKSSDFPIKGVFDGRFELSGTGASLEIAFDDSIIDLLITGTEGVVTAFELDDRSRLGLGLAGILGQSFDRPGITAMAQTIPYFKDIRYKSFVFELKRGTDQRITIPQLKLAGESLLISGTGSIAASRLSEVMDQPMSLGVELGAKGRLIDYLETLQLLEPVTASDGFRRWKKDIMLTGTLSDPNTDALLDLLYDAARSALIKPKATSNATGPANEPNKAATRAQDAESKAQSTSKPRPRDDIDMGLDLMGTVGH